MAAIALHRGKYRARIRRSGFPTISKSFTHKKDAVAWAALTEREIERGEYQSHNDCTRFTLADLLDRYQKDITPTKRSAEIELLRIGKIQRSWISTIKVGDLQPHHIAKYRDERLREIQGNAVARDLSLISDAINIAIKEWGYPLKRNPVQLVRKPPSNRNRNRRLEDGEAQSLLAAAAKSKNIWLIPIIEFAIETAMRRGEILGLRWADVYMEKRTLHLPITKNGESRTVPLSIRARQVLEGLPRDITGKVFPVTTVALRGLWDRACQRAEIEDLNFHDLRHEATSRFFEKGLNVIEVASITGHKDPRMLMRYTHLRAEDLAEKLG